MLFFCLGLQDQLSKAALTCTHFFTISHRWLRTDWRDRLTPHSYFIWYTMFSVCFVLTPLVCQYFKHELFHVSPFNPNPDILLPLKNERSWWYWLESATAAVPGTEDQLLGHLISPAPLPCATWPALSTQLLIKPTGIWISILACPLFFLYKDGILNYEKGWMPRIPKRTGRLSNQCTGTKNHLELNHYHGKQWDKKVRHIRETRRGRKPWLQPSLA